MPGTTCGQSLIREEEGAGAEAQGVGRDWSTEGFAGHGEQFDFISGAMGCRWSAFTGGVVDLMCIKT